MKLSKTTRLGILFSTLTVLGAYTCVNNHPDQGKTEAQAAEETPSPPFTEICEILLNSRIKEIKEDVGKNSKAQYMLGRCYFEGIGGVERNDLHAKFWYEKSAAQDYAPAQYMMGVLYDYGVVSFSYEKRLVESDEQQALAWYQKSAAQGYVAAQYALGAMHDGGMPPMYSSSNAPQAIFWYRQAADQNYAPAKNALGKLYLKGNGVVKSVSEGLFWLKSAADQGDTQGQYNLSVALRDLKKDMQQSLFWLKKSAENGNRIAQYRLGEAYLAGTGVKADDQLAFSWLLTAARQGEAGAQYQLSLMYREGKGTNKDETEAKYWLKEAEKNSALFTPEKITLTVDQLIYADSYASGYHGYFEPDMFLAFFWYQKAAELGDAEAEYELALPYQEGKGVAQDDDKAQYWLKKAADNGNKEAQEHLKTKGR